MAHFTIDITDTEICLTPTDHQFTLLWIHGLNESPQMHLRYLLSQPLLTELRNFRIVIPRAPVRHVTVSNQEMPSWFDIKFRNEKSFIVDFDEAFSRKDVQDSYQRILKPLLEREHNILQKPKTIFVGGFSQGCGMALHCLYSTKIDFAGCVGVSGYLFPITPFNNLSTFKRIIYGLADPLRPWEYVKVTYHDKIPKEQIILVEGMEHEVKKKETIAQLARFFQQAKEHLKKVE